MFFLLPSNLLMSLHHDFIHVVFHAKPLCELCEKDLTDY